MYKPLVDTVPSVAVPPTTPLTLHVTDVFVVPLTAAVNCCVWETCTEAVVGESATETIGTTVALAWPVCAVLVVTVIVVVAGFGGTGGAV